MKVLVTGGAGYIGGHTRVELQNINHKAIIMNRFVNRTPEVLERVKEIP